jgi:(E)-4-hydroxy-3-methylbut-2-enyl-diphosphate synthase
MQEYWENLTGYCRRLSREVKVGEVGIGGKNPLRLQSMTTTDTMNTEATVAQSIRMIEAGCELVRITAPSKKDAENLAWIKEKLKEKGYDTPLVADIHFTPNAAEIAADIVEKVRVNPGNYADKKKFEEIVYTDEAYAAELDRIEQKFTPLVLKCKANQVAMRIGTNHGSLSDRIMSRYGDTPKGMVESAMEFLRICRKHDYHQIILSMKASNTLVMVQAYRLLVATMKEEGMDYPLHLGVTEAGDGEDGRIKSAVGIGTLLEDGLGDTIRVSLTEEPEFEIPVARKLAERYESREPKEDNYVPPIQNYPINPYAYERRASQQVLNMGDKNVPVVVGDLSQVEILKPSHFFPFGYAYSVPLDKWNIADQAADYIYIGEQQVDFEIPGTLGLIQNYGIWQKEQRPSVYPLISKKDWQADFGQPHFLELRVEEVWRDDTIFKKLSQNTSTVLILTTRLITAVTAIRRFVVRLMEENIDLPVVIKRGYQLKDLETFQLYSATDMGALLVDGLGDGIWLEGGDAIQKREVISTAFGILQASRTRISKTEYISCPSCGRTLFDLQETTAKIRKVTSHLKGVKIGIMGCIVNGPGEMADADYGYVGTGAGKITLYKEKEVVKRNVPESEAVNELIELIKKHGDWVEAEITA